MDAASSTKDETTKKRPTNVLRACWECKRRKIHGQTYAAHEDERSLGGMTCTGSTEEENPCSLHGGERLSKLEQLFERFVCRKFTSNPATSTISRGPTLPEVTTDKQTRHVLGTLPDIRTSSQSIASIGEKILNWHSGVEQGLTPCSTRTSNPSLRTLVDKADEQDCETTRRSLAALLPSQNDSDVIFEWTNGWTIVQNMYKPSRELFVNGDPQTYALDMAAIARERPIIIARTLLHLAICISALPPEFDQGRLSQVWSLEAVMENYVATVTSYVTHSDESMCTLPGLETLLLLTIYHINCANLRQSWLIIRRAVNLAQLMGFHRIIMRPTASPPIEAIEDAKVLWRAIVDIETYLGLHLRLPFASEEYPCDEDRSPCNVHRARLNALTRQIAAADGKVSPQSYVQALSLDEKLEGLMKEMSKEFWEVPNVSSTARSPESATVLQILVQQMVHLELKILVHLPFLLRAHTESKYEYSKITAVQASRNVIIRWFALQDASITQVCCRFAELGMYIATVTIVLDILIDMGIKDRVEVQRTRGGDFNMVCRVIGAMEKLAKGSPREKIAARTAVVIRKLMCALDPSRRTVQSARLTIPYFGTIAISYQKPPIRPPFQFESDSGRKLNNSTTGSHEPVFSFVSNDLWPSPEGCWDGDLDFDIILFDGLEDKDTEGNWVF